jgi:hypothetical protein
MAYTQSDIDALRDAYKSGALRVRYSDGSEVLYHSRQDMKAILQEMEAEVSPSSAPARTSYATISRD